MMYIKYNAENTEFPFCIRENNFSKETLTIFTADLGNALSMDIPISILKDAENYRLQRIDNECKNIRYKKVLAESGIYFNVDRCITYFTGTGAIKKTKTTTIMFGMTYIVLLDMIRECIDVLSGKIEKNNN